MKLTITAKIQLRPTAEQKVSLVETMNAYKNSCNYVSDYILTNNDFKQCSIHNHTYRTMRDMFGLRSQMACSVTKTVLAKYKSLKTNDFKNIKPEFKVPQYDLVWNVDYSLKKDTFSINTLNGRIRIPYYSKGMEKYFDKEKYSFGTAKLHFKHGKFYILIPVSFQVEVCDDKDIQNVVGVDRGINFVITTYDSKGKCTFVSGRNIKHKRAKYSETRKRLQIRGTASSRRRLKKIGNRENRWMNDVNHCVSKALVLNNPKNTLFVLEDLTGIRSVTEKVCLKHRYINVSWSFYDLEQKIAYKAKRYGSKMIKVNPEYTSQTCPKCGHTERSNRDHTHHLFTCKKCGYRSNDDRIGAMNLHRMGIQYLVPDAVTDEHDLSVKGSVNNPEM